MNMTPALIATAAQAFIALCLALWLVASMMKGDDDDPL